MSATGWTNPIILQKFRERMNLQPEDVVNHAHTLSRLHFVPISEQQLYDWEHGVNSPDLEQLETLSEIYHCPVGYFFLEELPEIHLPLSYRGLAPEKEDKLSPLTQRTIRRFLEMSDWIATLIKEAVLTWDIKLEPAKNMAVEELVKRETERFGFSEQVRQQWKTTEEGYIWWRSKIEGLGVFCFEMKLEPGEIRGASRWIDSRYPFILVNHQDAEAATGRLFTLLHEYSHLLTSQEGIACDFRGRDADKWLETFANRFAARMLVSPEQLQDRLRRLGKLHFQQTWSDAELNALRDPFFVSRDVVAIMLQEMQLAPDGFYQIKRERWERIKPWGRGRAKRTLTKKERKAREIGRSAIDILLALENRQKLPLLDAAYALDMKVEKTTEFLQWARQVMPFNE